MHLYSNLNQELIEKFGKLEQLCNQIYGGNHGVTSYIEDMESLSPRAELKISNWNYFYKGLKGIRHKRNQLSHGEVSFSERYAELEDIDFISNFHNLILTTKDPISLFRRSINVTKNIKPSSNISKNTKGRGCLSEFVAYLLTTIIVAIILLLLTIVLTEYFK